MVDKREPLLIDEFINIPFDQKHNLNHYSHTQKSFETIQNVARRAKVFVFDTAATIRLGNLINEAPELLVKHQQFAIAPYNLMWIEFKFKDLYSILNEKQQAEHDTADKVGFLINNGSVHGILGGRDPSNNIRYTLLSDIRYELHLPWELNDQLEFCRQAGMSKYKMSQQETLEQLDFFFWGLFFPENSEHFTHFRTHHTASFMPLNERLTKRVKLGSDALEDVVRNEVGNLRNVIAILLLINRPGLTKYIKEVPKEKRFSGGKLKPFVSHTVVTIELNPVPQLQLIGTDAGDAIARRRHEVRGHFAHDQRAREGMRVAGCNHDWQTDFENNPNEDALEPRRWKCTNCGGKRWWRKEHERGDATLGFVIHDKYSIEGQPRSTKD